MKKLSVKILYPFKDGAWGGANQFLKALHEKWEAQGYVASTLREANVVLVNGNTGTLKTQWHIMRKLYAIKSDTLVVLRLDGPMKGYRASRGLEDEIFYSLAKNYAHGIIFQSAWSREQNYALGLQEPTFSTTILNAPNAKLFYPKNEFLSTPVKCIATSWSSHMNKGFAVYQWLDEHLDFSRYSMTFVGNSPIKFKNIQHIPPLSSPELAQVLREHDIYITASQQDPCSNSLIEAMHCRLPAIALRDGGHPEIVGKGGELFMHPEEIPSLLEKIVANYSQYLEAIALPNISDAAQLYADFMQHILDEKEQGVMLNRSTACEKMQTIGLMARYFLGVKVKNGLRHLKIRG